MAILALPHCMFERNNHHQLITIVRYQQHAIVSKPGSDEGRFRQPLPSLFTAADIIVGRYLLLIVVVLALSRSRIVGTTPQIRQRPLTESPRKH